MRVNKEIKETAVGEVEGEEEVQVKDGFIIVRKRIITNLKRKNEGNI